MNFTLIMEKLQAFAPEHFALGADNIGFQVGRSDKDVAKVCVTTDASDMVISAAVAAGADMIIAHHPIIFTPLVKVTDADASARKVRQLICHDINFVAMHTNYDVVRMGDKAAAVLGLTECRVFDVTNVADGVSRGIGSHGRWASPMTLEDCARHIRAALDLDTVRVYGDGRKLITSAAISPGSCGGNALANARRAEVDLFITGDIKFHMACEILESGIAVIDAGHFGTEKVFVPDLTAYLRHELPQLAVYAAAEINPFYVV